MDNKRNSVAFFLNFHVVTPFISFTKTYLIPCDNRYLHSSHHTQLYSWSILINLTSLVKKWVRLQRKNRFAYNLTHYYIYANLLFTQNIYIVPFVGVVYIYPYLDRIFGIYTILLVQILLLLLFYIAALFYHYVLYILHNIVYTYQHLKSAFPISPVY